MEVRTATRRSSTVISAYTLPSQAEATTVILCGALPYMPQFLKLTKQTVEHLSNSVRSHAKHTEDYPRGLLDSKVSKSLGRWHKSGEPALRRPTREYIPLADFHGASLHTSEATQIVHAKGNERRVDGRQTSESRPADLGSGIVKSIRIEMGEDTRRDAD